ncbi:unnamed protein product [Soboliphyme baturini]|uniref:RBPJ-interacting and tubulin-associated protein n=1 Tax=Soboliphyme baturini TaxID=241478 RepID=A0A183IFB3_9BILA|nr:unnamed protein product [Soboliphyme baturini]
MPQRRNFNVPLPSQESGLCRRYRDSTPFREFSQSLSVPQDLNKLGDFLPWELARQPPKCTLTAKQLTHLGNLQKSSGSCSPEATPHLGLAASAMNAVTRLAIKRPFVAD